VITYYFFSQVTSFGAHEGINDVNGPKLLGDPVLHPTRFFYAALVCCVAAYLLIRYLVRTPFGLVLQGIRDDPLRMRSLGYNITLHRTLGFGAGALVAGVAGVLSVWHNTRISPGSIDLTRTIDVLTVAVIGGLYRLEGAWIGALIFVAAESYTRGYTARFETWIGALFLVIVLLSPGGVAGIVTSLTQRARRLLAGRLGAPEKTSAVERA
jgi:branched-chain amino acid transport system permease protein